MAILGTIADRRAAVRKLAGNLDSTDISDADLDKIIEPWDIWVQSKTNKFTWISTDKEWLLVLKASDLMSSAEILDGIPRQEASEKAKDQRVAARDAIKSVNKKNDEIQAQEHTDAITGGPNILDELDPANYLPKKSEVY